MCAWVSSRVTCCRWLTLTPTTLSECGYYSISDRNEDPINGGRPETVAPVIERRLDVLPIAIPAESDLFKSSKAIASIKFGALVTD